MNIKHSPIQSFVCGSLALLVVFGAVHVSTVAAAAPGESGATEQATGAKDNSDMPDKPTASRQGTGELEFQTRPFGKLPDGREVTLFEIANDNGTAVSLIDYGATVVTVVTADRNGERANINLGFEDLAGYLGQHPFFGSTVGRYCNRIANGEFTLDGKSYQLFKNDGENHLHGGKVAFNRVLWQAKKIENADSIGVEFTYKSPDGDEGYPGNLHVTARYILTQDDELVVEFLATTDQTTHVNLTNHNYWNLAGAGAGKILDHELMVRAEKYLAVDEGLIPTGGMLDVVGTPLDFRSPHKIGERIEEVGLTPTGYDHCFVIDESDEQLPLAAQIKDPASGRVMEIRTSQPGIQFYTGNFLDGKDNNGGFNQHEAFCLETQHYPDTPHRPEFPTTVLKPGETYRQKTVHRFFAD